MQSLRVLSSYYYHLLWVLCCVQDQSQQNMYNMMQKQHNTSLLRAHILSRNRMMDPGAMYTGGSTPPNSQHPPGIAPMMQPGNTQV
jgi:hypothetical protein